MYVMYYPILYASGNMVYRNLMAFTFPGFHLSKLRNYIIEVHHIESSSFNNNQE